MFLLWIAVFIALIGLVQAFDRVRRLEQKTEELRRVIERLTKRLEEGVEAPSASVTRPEPTAVPRYEPPVVHQQPVAMPHQTTAAPPVSKPAVTPTFTPPPPPPPSRPSRASVPEPALPKRSFDWEALIGVKFFAIVASLALFLAGGFFVSYSMEHGWLTPPTQFAIGILAGIICLVLGELKGSRRYAWTADALDAAGISLLYVVFFASFARWHLVGATVAFVLFVLATAVAVLLAIRRASLLIALLGLIGGFASPAIVATGQDNPIGLFGYLLLLNAGLAWVAYKKRWPLLTAISLGLTTLYQWGWVSNFLTAGRVPLAAVIFLVFPVMSFVALALNRPADGEQRTTSTMFAHAARVGAGLPLVFSIYLAAVPAYGVRFGVLFGFLFCIDVGLFAVALFQGPRLLHVLGAASTLIVFAIWLGGSYHAAAWPGILVAIAAFTTFYLAAPFATSLGFVKRRVPDVDFGPIASRAVLAAPLLLFTFPVLIGMEPSAASPAPPFSGLLVLLAACAAFAIARREGLVYFVAAFFAVAAEAVWSAKYLTSERLLSGLAIYAIFALFFIGVPVLARRRGAPLAPQGAGAVLSLVSIALLFFLAGGAVAQGALWGIAILLAILTTALFAEASASRAPLLAIAGTILAWLVLALWWVIATVSVLLVPALAIVAGYSLLTMAGSVLAARRAGAGSDEESRGFFRSGAFVGLIGHFFLLYVASQPQLSIPPWPLFAVLGILSVAAGVAALYLQHGELLLAAMIAAPVVVIAWQQSVPPQPWSSVAIAVGAAFVVLAGAWLALARRAGVEGRHFVSAAAVAGVGAQAVVLAAAGELPAPAVSLLVVAQLAFVAATLGFATLDLARLDGMTVLAVFPAVGTGALWMLQHTAASWWSTALALTTPIYLAFVAYPLLLGRRAGAARAPYIATVLASVSYFFQARSSMIDGGYGAMIGALPVAEAALLALVLASIVRLERTGTPRTPAEITRLALIAGAALGFVTVAIPLQLERNWITIGWALEGAALAWLYARIPHKGLLWFTVGLCTAVFARLVWHTYALQYEPRAELRIWNWYLYTYVVCAAAMLIAGRVLLRTDDRLQPTLPRISSVLPGFAVILLFLLLNIEIADYFATGPTIAFTFFSSALAQDLSYTLGWAIFAVALLAAGIVTHSKTGRVTAIILMSVSMAKCAFYDLWRLGGLYRVGSLVGIAACALLITVALQKFVLTSRPEPREAAT